MLDLEGYTIEKCIRSTARSNVYIGLRDSDGLRVVLKAYRGDIADPTRDSRARREHEVTRRIDGPGVARVVDVHLGDPHPVLVIEYIDAQRLDSLVADAPLGTDAFLTIASRLADIVARVHAARLIHRDLKPSNVLITPATLDVHLIDFGLARPLGAISPTGEMRSATALLDDSLHYMAPEQSGRMARGVDCRSDLYSLGAVMYFALTGRPPFDTKDPLELVHAHIARLPAPPRDVRADVPPVLSDLVMKLLRKDPEERYQSAQALRAALAVCQERLVVAGHLEGEVSLAGIDTPERPIFSDTLFGRDEEVAAIGEAYDRAVAGARELVLVGGAPGAGKSALAATLRTRVLASGGYIAHCKLDVSRRDEPYAGIVDAWNGLIDQRLTESEERLGAWTSALRESLGSLAGVLVELIPALRIILGEVASPPALGAREAQARLALAMQRFVAASATRAHPLVLCVDDLQWADVGTLVLLESLLREGDPEALLVLGTFRDPDPDAPAVHAFMERVRAGGVPVQVLRLESLDPNAAARLLAQALRRDESELTSFVECVVRKTGSSPLLIRSFVELLHERGALRYEPAVGWVWDEVALEAADIPEDAVALVAKRIESIPDAAREVLAFAACIGDTIDSEQLTAISRRDSASLREALYALCDAGLLAPCPRGLRFVHDRIREAASGLLSEDARAQIHYEAGKLRLASAGTERRAERAAEISDHLNRCVHLLTDEERVMLIGLNISASERALVNGATSIASRYLDAGLAIFRETDWVDHAQDAFALHLASARAALYSGRTERALELLDSVEPHAVTSDQWSTVAAARIETHAVSRHWLKTTELTLHYLRRTGIKLPLRPSLWRVYASICLTDLALRPICSGKAPRRAEEVEDRRKAQIRLLSAGAGTIGVVSRRLALVVMAWRVRCAARRGYVRAPGIELIAFASYAYYYWTRPALLRRYAEIATSWIATLDDPKSALRARYVLCAMVNPWLMPRQTASRSLRELAVQAAELGETEFPRYCSIGYLQIRVLSGVRLAQAEREHQQLDAISTDVPLALIGLLREGGNDPEHVLRVLHGVAAASGGQWGGRLALYMLVAYVLGAPAVALDAVRRVRRGQHEETFGTAAAADLWLLTGLAAASLAHGSRGSERRAYVRELRRACRRMDAWAEHGPDFVHMAALLAAERAALRRRSSTAQALYVRAAERADRQGYPHHAGIAHERRAHLLRRERRDTQARDAVRAAIERFSEWGATSKVAQLRDAFRAPY